MNKKKRARKKRAKHAASNASSRSNQSKASDAAAVAAPVDKVSAGSTTNGGKGFNFLLPLIALGLIGALVFFLIPKDRPKLADQQVGGEVVNDGQGTTNATAKRTVEASVQLPTMPGLDNQRFDSVVRNVADREDPVLDGWQSERFNELASKQLKLVGGLLSNPSRLSDDSTLTKLATDNFQSNGLRPSELTSAFEDASLSVLRGETTDQHTFEGLDGFRELLEEQAKPLEGMSDMHFKFKIIRVELDGDYTNTRAYFQIDGRSDSSSAQVNSTWTCRWLNDSKTPLLEEVNVEQYEEITYKNSTGGPMFVDCTESVFRDSDRFNRQLIYGIDHWTDQFDGAIARPAAGHGIAIGDVNGDGLDDLYLCQSPALPNLLLIQNPDGTVRDTAVEAGVNWLEGTRAALLADLDNDGDQDLVAVLGSRAVVQENDGTGKFRMATEIMTPSSLFQINAVDYDNDGDLDLFICGYTGTAANLNDVFANPMPFHDANNGAPNVMLRNDGGWAFLDVTKKIGLDQNNSRFSYASAWDDLDNDGDLDLYIANDFGRNNLFRNDGGTFVDVAAELDVEDIGPGMSASWGDFNNDGNPDIYVSNMFSSAGNRITHQQQFKTTLDATTKKDFQRHARGNSLFEGTGDGKFVDRSVDLGVTLGRWAWGSLFVDVNNDGWEDLYVANGFVTADDNNDL